MRNSEETEGAYENQRDAEIFIASPDVVSVVYCCCPPVYLVEIEAIVVTLDILWMRPEGTSDTTPARRSTTGAIWHVERPTLEWFAGAKILFRHFHLSPP